MHVNLKLNRKERTLISLYVVSFVVFLIFFLLFSREVKALFFVTSYIFLNIFISSYKKNFQLPIEIEIITVGTVLCTHYYGLNAGLIVGIIGGLLSNVMYGYVSPFLIPMILGYALLAPVTLALGAYSISFIGIAATIAKNLLVFLIYHYVFSYDIGKNLSFSLSNVFINTVLFLNIAPFLAKLMA